MKTQNRTTQMINKFGWQGGTHTQVHDELCKLVTWYKNCKTNYLDFNDYAFDELFYNLKTKRQRTTLRVQVKGKFNNEIISEKLELQINPNYTETEIKERITKELELTELISYEVLTK